MSLHPIFAPILESIFPQSDQLEQAAEKALPRRFDGSSITGFGELAEESELREIAGFIGYSISADGRVWSGARHGRPAGGWLSIHIDRNGYRRAFLFDGQRIKGLRLARAVLQAFVGPAPSPTHQANHIDGDKQNDSASNLEWVTPVENTHHAIATGLVEGRSARLVDRDGRMVPIGELPRHPTLTASMVAGRVFEMGWSLAHALVTPALPRGYTADGKPKRPAVRAKLDRDQVLAISKDKRPLRVVAADYGVTPECISQILRGVTWAAVTGFGDLSTDIAQQTAAEREQDRQDAADIAARFGEGFTLFGDGERDEEAELQADQRQDLIRRSA